MPPPSRPAAPRRSEILDTSGAWRDRLTPPVGRRAERPPAADCIWDLDRFDSWRDVAWTVAADVLDERVRREFLRAPPKYVVGDDLGWLDDIVRRATRREVDSKRLMASRLAGRFEAIRACHATNTANVGAFYQRGILPLDPEAAHDTARSVFLGGAFPELGAAELEAAIARVGHHLRAGRVFFEVNERSLVEDCGHYLLYGGEYLTAIAASLGGPGPPDYRQALKRRGTPTVFVCNVPLAEMHGEDVVEAAGVALAGIFEALLGGDGHEPDLDHGFGFSILRRLAPERIVGHYHPLAVRDPLTGRW